MAKKNNIHKRGFASLSAAQTKKISSLGGKAAHKKGVAHTFSSSEARKAAKARWGKKAKKKKK